MARSSGVWLTTVSVSWAVLLLLDSVVGAGQQQVAIGTPASPRTDAYGSGTSRCLAAGGTLFPFTIKGSRVQEYDWNAHPQGAVWIQAKASASRDPSSFAALLEEMDAEPYWGKRVRLRAYVSVREVYGGAFAALFVRVVGAGGWTLAFDNMRRRRITGLSWTEGWQSVVLDVPLPPENDDRTCPADRSRYLPATVHAGVLLCGGSGFVGVDQFFLDTVGYEVPVTGGPAPWASPGPDM